MANLVMSAVGGLIPKLGELLKEEYNLQTGMKERIRSLTKELEFAQAWLHDVDQVPWDQLNKVVQLSAREVREASYDMEDVLDIFLVRIQDSGSAEKEKSLLKRLRKKMDNLFIKSKARHEIGVNTNDIMSNLQKVTERFCRYKLDDIVAKPATASTVDPRLHAMFNKVEDLVGIDKSSSELMQLLQREGASNLKTKIVVIVGVGGLGKTTLAKAVYDKLKGDFDRTAFIAVGRKPNLQQIIQGILIELDKKKYVDFNFAALYHPSQFITELRNFLHEKRYFIVIDDLWEKESWQTIKLAFDDNNSDSRIIITTRNREVSEKGCEIYDLAPLPEDSSRELFFIRIGGSHEGKLVDNEVGEVTAKFLKKCGGISLAIITMASLLADKPREKWDELYRCIGFGSEDDTMKIVSFSYYDLPVHLRTCLLYLSAFPEDSFIPKDSLVWKWVAEGFVKEEKERRLFETGEGYFNDLINRSMIEAVKCCKDDSIITGCRVHDMVLDFIRTMSHEENFFLVLDKDQGTVLLEPRRLAYHNMTMGHGHHQGDDLNMEKVRSLFAIRCGVKALDPFCGFKLLRVLVIENYIKFFHHQEANVCFGNQHVRQLLHLRFLSIHGIYIDRISEEIGRLRFLQTLDIEGSYLTEFLLPERLPEKLVFLSLPYNTLQCNDGIFSLMRLTSLEELSTIADNSNYTPWGVLENRKRIAANSCQSWRLPTGLRVLKVFVKAAEMAFWECVRHLNKLECLTISGSSGYHVTDFVLPSSLRHFASDILFCKLPSCINALCLPNLSHLELRLRHLDEHDLKTLGLLPELRFLGLQLLTPARVSSTVVVSEKDAAVVVYFPKLRCCKLDNAMVWYFTNEEEKSISFQMWGGGGVVLRDGVAFLSASEDKLQRPIISGSRGGGGAATGGGAIRNCFMPWLQVFRFHLGVLVNWDDRTCDNLGFEYFLPSLREIDFRIQISKNCDKIVAALRSEAEAHPNRPAFRLRRW